ncbi:MAG: MFS transporter [Candidatus Lokiarchaeota archaeon]|nr:MFS transporter [Candidatus Lokiarchaeota archaeon]
MGQEGARNPTRIHLSYACGSFVDDFLVTAFSVRVYAFYENEVLLPNFFLATAFIIYGVWNMVNDPLVGYVSDRPNRFTQRWGRRFPWFMLTAIPCAVTFTFIFSPPSGFDWAVFAWLVAFICLFDFLYSFWNTNWLATFPVKFRSHHERTRVAGIQTILSQVGLTVGMLVPPLFFTYGNSASYIGQALVVTAIGAVMSALMIPAMREKPAPPALPLAVGREDPGQGGSSERRSYFKTLSFALRQKNFLAYLVAYLGQTVMQVVMLASVPYLVEYLLHAEADAEILISGALLVGGAAMVPVWIRVSRKRGNRVGYMFGTGLTAALLVLFLFVQDATQAIVAALLLGMSMSATWTLLAPTFSDVIDETVVKMGSRSEGIFYGFRTFFGRLSVVIQALSFGIIHAVVGFDPEAAEQSSLALLGLRLQMTLVPALFYLAGFLCMWLVFDITPERARSNKDKLAAFGL